MKNTSLQNVIQNLEDLFEVLNAKYFDSELVKPVVTVSPDSKNSCYGWCTTYKAWQDKDSDEGYFEVNICGEHLTRPFEEVAGTMLHEMVHLYNLQNGNKDRSRGGTYHNKKFKNAAESHGLTCESDKKYGWSNTSLNDESMAEINDFMTFIGKESFDIYRKPVPEKEKKGGKKSSSRKYVCPICGTIIRATKEVKVTCADCNVMFKEVE